MTKTDTREFQENATLTEASRFGKMLLALARHHTTSATDMGRKYSEGVLNIFHNYDSATLACSEMANVIPKFAFYF